MKKMLIVSCVLSMVVGDVVVGMNNSADYQNMHEDSNQEPKSRLCGLYYYGYGDLEQNVRTAYEYALKALEKEPDTPIVPAFILGEMYRKGEIVEQDYEKAADYYQMVVDKFEQNQSHASWDTGDSVSRTFRIKWKDLANYELGNIYMNHLEHREEHQEKAVTLFENSDINRTHMMLGDLLWDRGEAQKAVEEYKWGLDAPIVTDNIAFDNQLPFQALPSPSAYETENRQYSITPEQWITAVYRVVSLTPLNAETDWKVHNFIFFSNILNVLPNSLSDTKKKEYRNMFYSICFGCAGSENKGWNKYSEYLFKKCRDENKDAKAALELVTISANELTQKYSENDTPPSFEELFNAFCADIKKAHNLKADPITIKIEMDKCVKMFNDDLKQRKENKARPAGSHEFVLAERPLVTKLKANELHAYIARLANLAESIGLDNEPIIELQNLDQKIKYEEEKQREKQKLTELAGQIKSDFIAERYQDAIVKSKVHPNGHVVVRDAVEDLITGILKRLPVIANTDTRESTAANPDVENIKKKLTTIPELLDVLKEVIRSKRTELIKKIDPTYVDQKHYIRTDSTSRCFVVGGPETTVHATINLTNTKALTKEAFAVQCEKELEPSEAEKMALQNLRDFEALFGDL